MWLALAVYAALLASLATPLYDPFKSGRDDTWAIAVLFVAANLGLGLAVARPWALLVPVAACVIIFFLSGAEATSWLILMFVLPAGVVATAIGFVAGRLGRVPAVPAATAVFALALAPAAWAGVETIKRTWSPHVPPAAQRALGNDGDFCPYAELPPAEQRDRQRRIALLVRELRSEPDAIVTHTIQLAEEPGEEQRDITVRELAEEKVDELRSNPSCNAAVWRRIDAALH